tara:strand:+ start:1679 stop:3043 length:1365 start_codon:yes stop_codon:yes gene_type:complete
MALTQEQIQKARDLAQARGEISQEQSTGAVSLLEKYGIGQSKPDTVISRIKSKIGEATGQMQSSISESQNLYDTGQQTQLETVGQRGAAAFKGLADIATSPVGAVLEEGYEALPEQAQQKISQVGQKVGEYISPTAQYTAEEYDKLTPRQKANLKALGNVVSFGTDVLTAGAGGKTAKVVGGKVVSDTLKNVAEKKAVKLGEKEISNALSSVTPDLKNLPDKEYEKLLSLGKVTPRKGITGKPEYILSKAEIEKANKYKGLLQSKDPAQNVIKIGEEVKNMDTTIGDFLQANNGIFNKGELRNALSKKLEDITDLTVDEKRLNKIKKTTIDNFVNGIQKNDQHSLWKARKEFDRSIENAFKGSPSIQKDMKKAFRNAVQDFIAEKTPDNIYKNTMKEMSDLINIQSLIADKASTQKGLNALQAWSEANPNKTDAVKWLVGGGIVGYGLNSALGN